MRHAIELAVLLLLMCIGHGAVNPAPGVVRRTATAFAVWCAVFAGAIAVLYSPPASAWLVRLGIVILGAYFARMAISGLLTLGGGARLFETPDTRRLALVAARISGAPLSACRRVSRRMAREYGGEALLLGLVGLNEAGVGPAEDFEAAWEAACGKARAEAEALAVPRGKGSTETRPSALDGLFVAQALCLYERRSVVRALKANPLGTRSARRRAAKHLEKDGEHREGAEYVGLIEPRARDGSKGESTEPDRLRRFPHFFLPQRSLAQIGFRGQAVALACCEGALLLYGLYGVLITRPLTWSFVWNTSPGVYLAGAVLLHVEGIFALGDFQRLSVHLKGNAISRGER